MDGIVSTLSKLPEWASMTPREKFNLVGKHQKINRDRKEEEEIRRVEPEAKKVLPKVPKPTKQKDPFSPPGGYYSMIDVIKRNSVSSATIKRYIANHQVKVYRQGFRIAVCECDVILAIEAGKQVRRNNGRITGYKNRKEGK